MTENVVRYIYPTVIRCPKPECHSTSGRRSGRSRGGRKRWRTCLGCGHVYIVLAVAEEIDTGTGINSSLRILS